MGTPPLKETRRKYGQSSLVKSERTLMTQRRLNGVARPSLYKTALHSLCHVGNLQLTRLLRLSDTLERQDLTAHNFVPFTASVLWCRSKFTVSKRFGVSQSSLTFC